MRDEEAARLEKALRRDPYQFILQEWDPASLADIMREKHFAQAAYCMDDALLKHLKTAPPLVANKILPILPIQEFWIDEARLLGRTEQQDRRLLLCPPTPR
jgi:hypothetical protein